jgi:3-methylfumaryl-CoA hydratase
MWAGSAMEIGRPILIGDPIERRSTIKDITAKDGRSGRLVFVTVEHEVHGPRGLALRERQDIVYRDPAPATEAVSVPPPAEEQQQFDLTKTFRPDAVKLFRFSALTFNGHRIHYDRDYARHEEGYRDLVVHGPLVATLLLALAVEAADTRQVSRFTWRGKKPAFANAALTLGARRDGPDEIFVAAVGPDGVTMEARAVLTPEPA